MLIPSKTASPTDTFPLNTPLMAIARVIPCLLLRNQGLVKTVKFQDPTYVGDPINSVRIFNEKEVCELIFLDIMATRENKPISFDLISRIATEAFMPFAYGGGIKSLDDAQKLFSIGVEKIVLNSALFENPSLVSRLAEQFGSQSVVAAIDVKTGFWGRYQIYSHCSEKKQGDDVVELAQKVEKLGAGEIFLNSIDRDGTQTGYDIALIKLVAQAVSIPVVACGGAGKLSDFRDAVKMGGASAVAAGSMFVFHGRHRAVLITYPTYQELKGTFA